MPTDMTLDYSQLFLVASQATCVIPDGNRNLPYAFAMVSPAEVLTLHSDDFVLCVRDYSHHERYVPTSSWLDRIRGISHRLREHAGTVYTKFHVSICELHGNTLVSPWKHTPRRLEFVTNSALYRPYRLPPNTLQAIQGTHSKFGPYTALLKPGGLSILAQSSRLFQTDLPYYHSDWFLIEGQPCESDRLLTTGGNLVCTNDWLVCVFSFGGDLQLMSTDEFHKRPWRL